MTTQQKPVPAVPTKVEVGQRWLSMNVEGVVEAPYQQSMGTWWMRFPTGRFPWSTEGILSLTYLGPLPGKAGVEAGSRWRCDDTTADARLRGRMFTVTKVIDDGARFESKWDDGICGAGRVEWLLDTCVPVASPPTGGVPVMGERYDGSEVLPAGCLECGTPMGMDVRDGRYFCAKCVGPVSIEAMTPLITAWRAGARDFPRRPAETGASGASDGIMPQIQKRAGFQGLDAWLPKADDKFVVPGEFRYGTFNRSLPHWAIGIDPGHETPAKPKPVLREVGAGPNGPWTRYDSLVDSDPFASYRHRRENGVVVAVAAATGYGGLTFAQHAKKDSEIHPGGLWRRRETPPPSPIDPTPGAGIPERRAYRTPSGGVK